MANYRSENVSLAYPAERVYDKLSNLEGLGNLLKNLPEDRIPADQRAQLEQVRVSADAISFPGGPVGDVTLVVAERVAPTLIRMAGAGTPVPLNVTLHVTPLTPDTCEAYVEIDLKVPMMLKPMLNGPMQKMTEQFAQMLRQIPME